MSRDLKTRERFSNSLKKELKVELFNLSKHTRIDQSKLLDEAIDDLCEKYKRTQGFKRIDTLSDKEDEELYG
ncbi:ribbon-helix-helix domain-containing protein [Bacillus atrophaeus]|uniref:ribbon-helix-helix domain-containing protein n=1 Tax=Bacillus atrophaeus TaxID=1452 RepID=UPI002282A579|nr:ribbon-helix-helix domain-containing protein [Bacillus atrophaeus]MCY7865971.1 ribbon-helix-helix domain-containing protein [Bacillus spizizenii]MCY8890468.1 ribbon-helix-helix domain-containing protein [Bacillus spizizenii]MEC0841923.1 ribbon-helix-helix domain-containing protein [Bacillus spizizenii]MED1125187.1 ribbon-helix-helix domain-containing protein [Bacillus atrophaeus]